MSAHLFFLFSIFYLLSSVGYAKEITILYTGETHAMLYPCSCPKEPDGGIARRAALVKELRRNYPNSLLLDSGGFFAGGLMDEYTQNIQLDMERTKVNLKAMEMMQYNAVTIGDDEFNFGREFLEENIAKTKLTFLSGNLKSDLAKPYLIKEVSGVKFGIIGVTTLSAAEKAGNAKFIEPKAAVIAAQEELKKKGVKIIVLLSHLGESEDLKLITEIPGIDILIAGHIRDKEEASSKVGSTIILRPSWQGRRLGKISLSVKDDKITNYKAEEVRLSDKISDDPEILKILPKCFSDRNCKEGYKAGLCRDAGGLKARCEFPKANKVPLLVIMPSDCLACTATTTLDTLKRQFPGLEVSYLNYPGPKAGQMIKTLAIKALPVFLLDRKIEKEEGFADFKQNLEPKGNFYMLRPEAAGFSYFLERKKEPGRLDLFISLYDNSAREILDVVKEFRPNLHFLTVEQNNNFDAKQGALEVEEDLRAVCVGKYYPEKFWEYIACRSGSINSSWWEDCLDKFDTLRIKNCARGQEAKELLKENIRLNKELGVMYGPVYLKDNREIFGFKKTPKREELKKILKR